MLHIGGKTLDANGNHYFVSLNYFYFHLNFIINSSKNSQFIGQIDIKK